MAKIGSIPLLSIDQVKNPGGAAFLLATASGEDALQQVENGEIEICSGQPFLVARFSLTSDAKSAFQKGHSLTQKGLDLLSILGIQDLIIRDAENEHIIWWTEEDSLVVRTVSTTLLKFGVAPAKIIIQDTEGKQITPNSPVPTYHIAFRYYRLSQTTDDLFDAYRNMYLAFESLLSSRYPKGFQEGEGKWLQRTLKAASEELNLEALGESLNLNPSKNNDIVETILKTIYKDTRNPIFHAKEGNLYFAPQDSLSNCESVSKALAVLTQIVLRMTKNWHDAQRMGGGVYFGWVYENIRQQLANCSAYASSYDANFDPSTQDLSHVRFAEAARMSSRLAPEFERDCEPAVLSTLDGQELARVSLLRRVELASGNTPCIAHILEAPLELEGVGRLEDLIHICGFNLNQPRSMFRQ
jgi:hypothetical protein